MHPLASINTIIGIRTRIHSTRGFLSEYLPSETLLSRCFLWIRLCDQNVLALLVYYSKADAGSLPCYFAYLYVFQIYFSIYIYIYRTQPCVYFVTCPYVYFVPRSLYLISYTRYSL